MIKRVGKKVLYERKEREKREKEDGQIGKWRERGEAVIDTIWMRDK